MREPCRCSLTPSLAATICLGSRTMKAKAGSHSGHFHTLNIVKKGARQSTDKGIFSAEQNRQFIVTEALPVTGSHQQEPQCSIELQWLKCYPMVSMPSPCTSLHSVLQPSSPLTWGRGSSPALRLQPKQSILVTCHLPKRHVQESAVTSMTKDSKVIIILSPFFFQTWFLIAPLWQGRIIIPSWGIKNWDIEGWKALPAAKLDKRNQSENKWVTHCRYKINSWINSVGNCWLLNTSPHSVCYPNPAELKSWKMHWHK